MGGRIRAAAVAAAAMAVTGCSSDPAMWEAFALGLEQAAEEIEYENVYCYRAPPRGLPNGVHQRYCPGDYGYRDIYIPPESPYWRRGDRHAHRDRGPEHRRDRDDNRGRDHERRGR